MSKEQAEELATKLRDERATLSLVEIQKTHRELTSYLVEQAMIAQGHYIRYAISQLYTSVLGLEELLTFNLDVTTWQRVLNMELRASEAEDLVSTEYVNILKDLLGITEHMDKDWDIKLEQEVLKQIKKNLGNVYLAIEYPNHICDLHGNLDYYGNIVIIYTEYGKIELDMSEIFYAYFLRGMDSPDWTVIVTLNEQVTITPKYNSEFFKI
jgi:hypothetical protein